MSTISLIISPIAIDEIVKIRYFKHHLIYQNPFIYSRMANNVVANDKLNGEFLAFLKNLNEPIYFAVGELTHNQSELEFALQLLKENNLNHCQILTDDLIVLPKQIYQI